MEDYSKLVLPDSYCKGSEVGADGEPPDVGVKLMLTPFELTGNGKPNEGECRRCPPPRTDSG